MDDIEKRLIEFYNGIRILEILAAGAYAVPNLQALLEQLNAFEKAYTCLIELHKSGRLGVGATDFSFENLARIKRIAGLIRQGLDHGDTKREAQEIHLLATQCMQALTRKEASQESP